MPLLIHKILLHSCEEDNRKQFQSQNWTIICGIQLMWKKFKLFKETAKSIHSPIKHKLYEALENYTLITVNIIKTCHIKDKTDKKMYIK